MEAECPIHKKYTGKRKPKNQCPHCLSLYFTLKGERRQKLPPNKVHKDKSKYDRKKDKKDKELLNGE